MPTVRVEGPVRCEAVDDLQAMQLALEQARMAAIAGDVPVGAIVLLGDDVIAARHNEREAVGDPTAHAEVLALRDAAAKLGSWRLSDTTLVVTLEPCAMCAGAALNARIGALVVGAPDLKAGACGSLYNLVSDPRLNHEVPMRIGVLAEECSELLMSFFAARR